MENVLKPLPKSVLIPLELKAASSVVVAGFHKKPFESGMRPLNLVKQTIVIISNGEMKDLIKIVKSLRGSGLLMQLVKQLRMKQKNKKVGYLACY